MSANHTDLLIYGRTMADARRMMDERVARALAPKCANPDCGNDVDEMFDYCPTCKANGYGVEQ